MRLLNMSTKITNIIGYLKEKECKENYLSMEWMKQTEQITFQAVTRAVHGL